MYSSPLFGHVLACFWRRDTRATEPGGKEGAIRRRRQTAILSLPQVELVYSASGRLAWIGLFEMIVLSRSEADPIKIFASVYNYQAASPAQPPSPPSTLHNGKDAEKDRKGSS